MKGVFVVFEGIDGSGKSTQAQRFVSALRRAESERTVLLTAEPSQKEIGQLIRSMLVARPVLATQGAWSYPWRAMTLLFAADRAAHLANVIDPALDKGAIVVCDRYILSTVAYQLASALGELKAQGIDLGPGFRRATRATLAEWLRDVFAPFTKANVTFVLEMPVDAALARLKRRGGARDCYETDTHLRETADIYWSATNTHEFNWCGAPAQSIDATGSEDEVAERIQKNWKQLQKVKQWPR
jgi:dTMP kinase